jgi:hypothetical protein
VRISSLSRASLACLLAVAAHGALLGILSQSMDFGSRLGVGIPAPPMAKAPDTVIEVAMRADPPSPPPSPTLEPPPPKPTSKLPVASVKAKKKAEKLAGPPQSSAEPALVPESKASDDVQIITAPGSADASQTNSDKGDPPRLGDTAIGATATSPRDSDLLPATSQGQADQLTTPNSSGTGAEDKPAPVAAVANPADGQPPNATNNGPAPALYALSLAPFPASSTLNYSLHSPNEYTESSSSGSAQLSTRFEKSADGKQSFHGG